MNILQNKNIATFNSSANQETYSQADYWRADENNLIDKYFINHAARLLIIGCGAGRTIEPIYNKGFKDITAIDIASEMIKFAESRLAKKKIYGVKLMVLDGADLKNFSDASFDYVFFPFHGVDYIFPEERRYRCFKEINRVLAPGGILIFNSHNLFFPRFLKRYLKNKRDHNYICINGVGGEEWTYHINPLLEYFRLSKIFSRIKMNGRSRLADIKSQPVNYKEKILYFLPFLDKSVYYICFK